MLMSMQDPAGTGSSNPLQKKLIGVHWKMMVNANEMPDAAVMPMVTYMAVRSPGNSTKGKNRR